MILVLQRNMTNDQLTFPFIPITVARARDQVTGLRGQCVPVDVSTSKLQRS
jgi:hypothetical protein